MSHPGCLLRRPAIACIAPKPASPRTSIPSVGASGPFCKQASYFQTQCPRSRYLYPSLTCFRRPKNRPVPLQYVRSYHSEFHPLPDPPADTYTLEQSAILSTALKHVPEYGFSTKAVIMGAREAGYLDVSLQLFPRGGEFELVLYWLASRRGLLKQKVESGEIFGQKDDAGGSITPAEVDQRVRTLIMERLKMNTEIIHHWQDALAIMSLPPHVPPSLCELYRLSSDILYLANDRSVDASWYTRRISVATIYASADINMTEDVSPGFSATMEFVDRRINDADAVTDTLSDVKRYMGYVAGSVVAAGRSWGMKV
ncbi:Ubiquinone biosynthesis protein coq9, mitochondrial [Coccidioides immitis]|uniref:Ubiquinone biosynthesis protein n=2 Tax=Coccidioides immitis TaxID=5501 RepID=A0A0J8QXZ6_COCIT|nr:ubiquinone biosynthesis protein COQ9 [Coccidioides immitis RMSCC 2394]KMU76248.1 ubiquinone biosynthesis protein COQ9 [Coccidioides immitis RMSCC 3703]TPX25456.1 Ubiquinone biosynthesis protein coq9, mitochondrial [Coccidioides immitis]